MSANKNINLNLKDLPAALGRLGHKFMVIAPLAFFVLVGLLYGFLLLRIGLLSNIQPDSADVSKEVSSLTPHIDQKAAAQLQGLEDNSVNVKTLFNDARNNPFGE
jgi:hypothetical protein